MVVIRRVVVMLCLVVSGIFLQVGTAMADANLIEIRLNDYFVTNVSAESRKYVKFSVLFQVKDQATADALNQNQSLIRNAILLAISDEQYETLKTVAGKKDFQTRLLPVISVLFDAQQLPHEIDSISFSEFMLD